MKASGTEALGPINSRGRCGHDDFDAVRLMKLRKEFVLAVEDYCHDDKKGTGVRIAMGRSPRVFLFVLELQ